MRDPAPSVIFMGRGGTGKTSLIRACFGLPAGAERYPAAAPEVTVAIARLPRAGVRRGRPTTVIDTPGYAESLADEPAYIALYRRVLPGVTHVVWTVRAHPRRYRPDEIMFAQVGDSIPASARILFALTHVDTIGAADWDTSRNRPSQEQQNAIADAVAEAIGVFREFWDVQPTDLVPCAGTRGFGVDRLTAAFRARGPIT